jgi:hypothetical protein
MTQGSICPPFLSQLNRGAIQIALELLEFGFKPRKQGKSIFLALCLMTVSPSVTWPSPATAVRLLRRTRRIVVP